MDNYDEKKAIRSSIIALKEKLSREKKNFGENVHRQSKHSVIIKWSDADGGFIATVPELEGLSAFGNTLEEAAKEITEAKKLYLEVLQEDKE